MQPSNNPPPEVRTFRDTNIVCYSDQKDFCHKNRFYRIILRFCIIFVTLWGRLSYNLFYKCPLSGKVCLLMIRSDVYYLIMFFIHYSDPTGMSKSELLKVHYNGISQFFSHAHIFLSFLCFVTFQISILMRSF